MKNPEYAKAVLKEVEKDLKKDGYQPAEPKHVEKPKPKNKPTP